MPNKTMLNVLFNLSDLRVLHTLIDCTRQYVKLLFACKLNEVHGITANTDSELRILLWMLHSIKKQVAVEHVDIDVLSTSRCEVAVEQRHEIGRLHILGLAKSRRRNSEGIRDTVA